MNHILPSLTTVVLGLAAAVFVPEMVLISLGQTPATVPPAVPSPGNPQPGQGSGAAPASTPLTTPISPADTGPRPVLVTTPNDAAAAPTSVMRSAVESIETRTSISAKVRERIDLFGQRLVGSGAYLQQGRGAERLWRFELKLLSASYQQICDGKFLWIHQDLGGKSTLGKIDLARVNDAVRHQASLAGQGGTTSTFGPGGAWLGLGGLPKLMSELDRGFQFTATAGQLDSLPVWILQGTWRNERLAELIQDPKEQEKLKAGKPPNISKMGDHFPERVVLLIGRDDLFPYRLEYWRRESQTKLSERPQLKLAVLMELFEVALDTPVDSRAFTFKPGELEQKDLTPAFLQNQNLEN